MCSFKIYSNTQKEVLNYESRNQKLLWKRYGGFSKKLKIELSYDSAIPLVGIHSKNIEILISKMQSPQNS